MADTKSLSKRKYLISFSNTSQQEAELKLQLKLVKFYGSQTPIKQFITKTAPGQLKKEIFKRLNDYIIVEGFPEATISPLNEAIITDHVGVILTAMISHHMRTIARNDVMLEREKQIISTNEDVDEDIGYLVVRMLYVGMTCNVLVVEVKSNEFGRGLTQLLLSLKSMWDLNGDQQLVYGLITTAIDWQLVTYDGQTWKISERCTVLLPNMIEKEDKWLENNTQILDVIHSILSSL